MKKSELFVNQEVTYQGNNDTTIYARFLDFHPEKKGLALVQLSDGDTDLAEISTMQSVHGDMPPGVKVDKNELHEGKAVYYENNNGYEPATFQRLYTEGLCWVKTSEGSEDVAEISRLREDKPSSTLKIR